MPFFHVHARWVNNSGVACSWAGNVEAGNETGARVKVGTAIKRRRAKAGILKMDYAVTTYPEGYTPEIDLL